MSRPVKNTATKPAAGGNAAAALALAPGPRDHRCRAAGCGAWASFGFSKPLVGGETQWFCGRHVPPGLRLRAAELEQADG